MEQLLEIGPGTSPRLIGKNVVYLDRRDLPLPNFIIWDLQNLPLPFPDDTFDECQAHQVFEHIPSLAPVFDEIHRILKPTGLLKLGVPHYKGEPLEGPWLDHVHQFSERTFKNLEIDTCTKKWKIVYMKVERYRDRASLITKRGRVIKSVMLRKLVWRIFNFWKLNLPIHMYVEIRPVK